MLRISVVLLSLAATLGVSADANAQRRKSPSLDGAMLTQSCFACHGPEGASIAGPMPIIGGQTTGYLTTVLNGYRSGDRSSTIMGRLMRGYSETEISAIAAYLTTLPYRPAPQAVDAKKVETGRASYNRVCKKCHLDGGRDSSESDYPKLAGQWLPYMQETTEEILGGRRKVDEKFSSSLGKLTREEIDAVLHFFAAQQ